MISNAMRERVLSARTRGPRFTPYVDCNELTELLDERDLLVEALKQIADPRRALAYPQNIALAALAKVGAA